MSRRLLVLLPLLLAAGPASVDPAKQLSGRYYRQFQNGTIDGDKYTGEDVVEIVPVAPRAAYVRIHLDFFNGHECDIYGIANAERDALVLREQSPVEDNSTCVLQLRRTGKSLLLSDDAGVCSAGNCGARGGFDGVSLPYSSKRPIRYLARLKNSSQYRDAMAEWSKKKK